MAKAKEITLVNTGLSALYINRVRLLPDEEIEVSEDRISEPSFMFLISRGELAIKDDSAKTAEIKAKAAKTRKKDPTEGKSQKELEDGGEY